MTIPEIYECDVTGERFEEKSEVLGFEIRRYGHSPFNVRKREVHISEDKLSEEVDGLVPNRVDHVGVKEGKIVGAVIPVGHGRDKRAAWKERDNVTIDHYESFFQFVEEEVVW